jgi:hypothetical protein
VRLETGHDPHREVTRTGQRADRGDDRAGGDAGDLAEQASAIQAIRAEPLRMALGGAIGDPLNGLFFDLLNGYRALFLLMACYAMLAFVAVLFVPRGAGEADTGPDAVPVLS